MKAVSGTAPADDIFVPHEHSEGSAGLTVEGVVFHGRSLRVYLLSEDKYSLAADLPRQSEHAAMTTGNRFFASLRPGTSCPILPA
ncbi:hypothetical protein A6U86_24285 [Rhizobium sp. AC27/96]|nr:hypothetical protein A6U86_24285 [Rhizobium sp. AC27/96]